MTNMVKDLLGKLGDMHTKGNSNSRDMKMPGQKDTVRETVSASRAHKHLQHT